MARDLTTPEGIVTEGMRIFEALENRLKNAKGTPTMLEDVFNAASTVMGVGVLQASEIMGKIGVIEGKIAEAIQLTYALHREGTKIAQDAGHDVLIAMGGPGR